MKIKILDIQDESLARIELKAPLKSPSGLIHYTCAPKVKLSIDGKEFYGELSKFPLFYGDQDLSQYKNLELEFDTDNLKFNSLNYDNEIPINFLFMLEQAIIHYVISHNINIGLNTSSFNESVDCSINLLSLTTNTSPGQTTSCLKIKIGRDSVEKENYFIRELLNNDPGIMLRLDGNHMLSVKQLESLLEGIELKRIEYIEEPFEDMSSWESFLYKNEVSLALDEEVQSFINNDRPLPTNTSAFIVKPTLVFGLFETLKLFKRYTSIKKIISSSFEDEYTLNTLIHMASLAPYKTHHGLGTLTHLNKIPLNIIQDDIKIQGLPISRFKL